MSKTLRENRKAQDETGGWTHRKRREDGRMVAMASQHTGLNKGRAIMLVRPSL